MLVIKLLLKKNKYAITQIDYGCNRFVKGENNSVTYFISFGREASPRAPGRRSRPQYNIFIPPPFSFSKYF